jgi:hypothetical protein
MVSEARVPEVMMVEPVVLEAVMAEAMVPVPEVVASETAGPVVPEAPMVPVCEGGGRDHKGEDWKDK